MPKISVIVPVYKSEPYLRRCVDSILNQTFPDFELILVDDGSPDNCPEICDEYAKKDLRITVIHQHNQGIVGARTSAIAQSKANWICFVDSDDMIHPQMLEHMYGIAQNTGAGITACGVTEDESVPHDFFADETDTVACCETNEEGLLAIHDNWKYCYWVVWGKLIRKELVERFPMTKGRIYEDNAVVFRWLYEAGMVAYTNTAYYYYQINPEGVSKSSYNLKKLDWLWALKEQIIFYRSVGYRTLDRKFTAKYLIESVWAMDKCHKLLNNPEAANAIRRDMRLIKQGTRLSSLPLTPEQKKHIRKKLYPRMDRYTSIIRKLFRRYKRLSQKWCDKK